MLLTKQEILAIEKVTDVEFNSITQTADELVINFTTDSISIDIIKDLNDTIYRLYIYCGDDYESPSYECNENDLFKTIVNMISDASLYCKHIKEHFYGHLEYNQFYVHHSGEVYELKNIGNKSATKKDYPMTVSYENIKTGELYMRPYLEFTSKFVRFMGVKNV